MKLVWLHKAQALHRAYKLKALLVEDRSMQPVVCDSLLAHLSPRVLRPSYCSENVYIIQLFAQTSSSVAVDMLCLFRQRVDALHNVLVFDRVDPLFESTYHAGVLRL